VARPDPWLRRPERGEPTQSVLICFPHAGGAASFYTAWSPLLPPWLDLLAVQYPGREDRLLDAQPGDLHELADLITGALEGLRGRPVALFGHSMGAAVAYEVACRLEKRRQQPLMYLVVSGFPPPGRLRRTDIHLRDDEGVVAELMRLAPGNEALRERQLVELMLPTIRNDCRIIECYQPSGIVLSCPVLALIGDRDPDISVDDMQGWQELTRGPFTTRVFPGDHFYLSQPAPVVAAMVSAIAQALGHGGGTPAGLRAEPGQARAEPGHSG
jgi:pyochelin biosynthetic protein PchC